MRNELCAKGSRSGANPPASREERAKALKDALFWQLDALECEWRKAGRALSEKIFGGALYSDMIPEIRSCEEAENAYRSRMKGTLARRRILKKIIDASRR